MPPETFRYAALGKVTLMFFQALPDIIHYGYGLLFLATAIEGPIITAIAGFLITLGYFNFLLVFLISVLGDVIPDLLYFSIGKIAKAKFLEEHGHWVGLTKARMEVFDHVFEKHKIKAIIILKIAPFIPGPGFIAAGTSKLSYRTFTIISVLVTLPKNLAFLLVGYLMGTSYQTFFQYYKIVGLLILALFFIGFYYAFKKVSEEIAEKLQES
ncbi:MAG TPA: VTT domain-containing protein [Candidatus Paceibacterota bacterium]|nr:VTT domain-containing protein [Candidatus Paceibacterota bacterium]